MKLSLMGPIFLSISRGLERSVAEIILADMRSLDLTDAGSEIWSWFVPEVLHRHSISPCLHTTDWSEAQPLISILQVV